MEEENKKEHFSKFKQSRLYRGINTFASSAIIGLAITLLIFAYKVYSGKKQFDETVNRLDGISHSLSTRCLGKFPAYISEINDVFSTLEKGDTIIIFEDVLYYGIKSDPTGFSQLQQHLLNHSRQGGKVIVAYYDNHYKGAALPWVTVFHRMIVESRISSKYLSQIFAERHNQFGQLAEKQNQNDTKNVQDNASRVKEMAYIDSCITEKYFALTRDNDRESAQKNVNGYLSFLERLENDASSAYSTDFVVKTLCIKLDSIMQHYIGKGDNKKEKSLKEISFADYEHMYSEITDCIASIYKEHGIELVQLNEYLTMSCWLVKPAHKNRSASAILAFPSKYSSDEIGFYSQDELFSDYITTILKGVKGDVDDDKERPSNF